MCCAKTTQGKRMVYFTLYSELRTELITEFNLMKRRRDEEEKEGEGRIEA